MLCSNCHNEIPEGLIFCPHCGSKVTNDASGSEKEKALQKKLTEAESQNQLLENRLKNASEQISSLSAKLSEETSRKKKVPGVFKVFTVCFFGAAAALCIVLFQYMDIKTSEDYFGNLYTDAYSDLTDAQNQIDELTDLNEYLQYEVDFVDANVAFINADDEEGLYHTFYCDDFIGDDFYALNTAWAENEGLTACPDCHY